MLLSEKYKRLKDGKVFISKGETPQYKSEWLSICEESYL